MTITLHWEILTPIISLVFSRGKSTSLFKHNCVWAYSKRGESVCKCRRVKIKRGENNPIYTRRAILFGYKYNIHEYNFKLKKVRLHIIVHIVWTKKTNQGQVSLFSQTKHNGTRGTIIKYRYTKRQIVRSTYIHRGKKGVENKSPDIKDRTRKITYIGIR